MSGPFHTRHHGDIVYVEYIDGRPHQVVTTKDGYDFSWSDHEACSLYHASSGGCPVDGRIELSRWCDPSSTSFWAADTITLVLKEDWDKEKREYRVNRPATDDDIQRLGLTRLEELPGDPFEDAEEAYHGTEYCMVCEDHFKSDHTCRHLFGLESGGTGGPGASDPDFDADSCKDSLQKFARATGFVRALRKGLVPFTWKTRQLHAIGGLGPSVVWVKSAGRDLGNIADKVESGPFEADELRDGINWFFALDEKTTAANDLTAQWLDEIVTMQDSDRRSGAVKYLVMVRDSYVSPSDGRTSKQRKAQRMSWAIAMDTKRRVVAEAKMQPNAVRIIRLIPRRSR